MTVQQETDWELWLDSHFLLLGYCEISRNSFPSALSFFKLKGGNGPKNCLS